MAVSDLERGSVTSSGPMRLTVGGQRLVESAGVLPLVVWIPAGMLALLDAALRQRVSG